MKYAIKVWFDDDTWAYISEGPLEELRVVTVDTLEQAQKCADLYKIAETDIEIVEYQP